MSDEEISRNRAAYANRKMGVTSLRELALRKCVKEAGTFTGFGDLPWRVVRPIIMKVTSAEQLRKIEENCPHLIGDDAEAWRAMVKKDIPVTIRENLDTDFWEQINAEYVPVVAVSERVHEPEDAEKWYDFYKVLKEVADLEAENAANKLAQSMKDAMKERKSHTIKQIGQVPIPARRRWGASAGPVRAVDMGAGLISGIKNRIRGTKKQIPMIIGRRTIHDKRVVTQVPAAMLQDYQRENLKKTGVPPKTSAPSRPAASTKPAASPAAAPYRPAVSAKPLQRYSAPPTVGKVPDVMEKRRQAEAQFSKLTSDGTKDSASRKRPAPSMNQTQPSTKPTRPPPSSVFVQPAKRRKMG